MKAEAHVYSMLKLFRAEISDNSRSMLMKMLVKFKTRKEQIKWY